MEIRIVNKALTYLLIYYVVLVLLSGVLGSSIEDDIARIFILYSVPLVIIIGLYLVAIGFEMHSYMKTKTITYWPVVVASIKATLAVLPMLFLNNSLGNLLAVLRIK